MKVIELLNKIANGEKVPKVIYFWEREYIYDEEYNCYMHQTGANEFINLLDNDTDDSYCFLNDEVQLSRFGDVEVLEHEEISLLKWNEKSSYNQEVDTKKVQKILLSRSEQLKSRINEIINRLNDDDIC